MADRVGSRTAGGFGSDGPAARTGIRAEPDMARTAHSSPPLMASNPKDRIMSGPRVARAITGLSSAWARGALLDVAVPGR